MRAHTPHHTDASVPHPFSILCRYGNAPPGMVFVERKTHRESWKGEESVKERFVLAEDKVVDFLDGEPWVCVVRMRVSTRSRSPLC